MKTFNIAVDVTTPDNGASDFASKQQVAAHEALKQLNAQSLVQGAYADVFVDGVVASANVVSVVGDAGTSDA